jgi:hypothetical protein
MPVATTPIPTDEVVRTAAFRKRREDFERRVARLVELSIGKGHDAFEDVPWDDPEFVVEATDPRNKLWSFDPLADTDWYRSLDEETQALVGLHQTATKLRVGWEFENLLQQGLLALAFRMDNDDASFPYVHQEVMEESQHTLMFYEFNRRYAPEVGGMPRLLLVIADPLVYVVARRWPALFFFMVLGGEIPVDHLQRLGMKEPEAHPLIRHLMAIHVEEEARHVSYANQELRRRVPQMSRPSRAALSVTVPPVMAIMGRLMTEPTSWLRRRWGIPSGDLRKTYRKQEHRQLLPDSLARIRKLCDELGLLNPAAVALWKLGGIWDE